MSALDPTQTLVELTMAICDIESVSSNEAKLADEIEQILTTARIYRLLAMATR